MCTWGSCPTPCLMLGSVGAVYSVRPLFPGGPRPSQSQGDTRRNNHTGGGQLPSPRVSSCSNYRSLPVCTGLDAPGLGVLICSWGTRQQEHSGCLVPPCLLLSLGERSILGCVPWFCGIQGLHHRNCAPGPRSPLRAELPPELLLGHSRGPPGVLQPFRELSPWSVARSPPG